MFRRVFCSSISRASPFNSYPPIPQPLNPKPQFSLHTPKLQSFHSSPNMSQPHKPKITVPVLDKATRPELLRAIETAVGSPFNPNPTRPAPPPIVIVISGPSGVGKDAVIKKLREKRENLHFVVTATSRPMRPGEVHGKDYYFVSKDEFLNMVERNELLEYALVYGDYKGIPNRQIRENLDRGLDVVVRVDIQGADTLRRKLGDSAVFVFLVAESEVKLVERLIDRKTEKVEELATRVAAAKVEMQCVSNFDYVVVNAEGKLDEAVRLLGSIIDSEKARVFPRKATI